MNLQKRKCPIKFEVTGSVFGWLNISLHIGKDKKNADKEQQ